MSKQFDIASAFLAICESLSWYSFLFGGMLLVLKISDVLTLSWIFIGIVFIPCLLFFGSILFILSVVGLTLIGECLFRFRLK